MKCEICGEEISGGSAFTCSYCKGVFCPKHRLPFNHFCKNIHAWKMSGLPGEKRPKHSRKIRYHRLVPFYQKKEIITAALIIGILIILALYILFR